VYFPVLRDLAATPDSAPYVPMYPGEMTLFVRAAVAPATLIAPIRRIVGELDPYVPVTNPRTLEDVVSASTARARLTMLLLLTGSGVALILGVIGIYGVVSYSVSQRTPEIGIRMALGATPASVNAMVLREGAGMTAVGLVGGVLASLLVTRLLRGLLYGVSPTEPFTIIAMILLLFSIALAASYLPARRAARIDPVLALRAE
jgi:putative ABC transport system permease protein